MFQKGLEKKESKKFKKLLEDSVVFLDVNNLQAQQKKNNKKTTTKKNSSPIKYDKRPKNKEGITKPGDNLNQAAKDKSSAIFNEQIINFIPEVISTIPTQRKRLAFLAIGILLVILVNAILYISLLKYKISLNENISKILKSNERINKEYVLEKASLEQYKDIKEKIDLVAELLNNHIYWTYVIDVLMENKIDTVNVKNFSGTTTGMVYLSMESMSYKDIADQINKFKEYLNFYA